MRLKPKHLLSLEAELRARKKPLPGWDPRPFLSPVQLAAESDRSRFQAWAWGRRAGKTDLAEKVLLRIATSTPGCQVYYINRSIKRAVATVWNEIVDLNRKHSLGGIENITMHTVTFPGGTRLYVTGVENQHMADDLRGRQRVAAYFIDEAQGFPDELLRYFYNYVIIPSLADVGGAVYMAGTGGAPRGFWYEAATSLPEWSRHTGTPFDNPFLPAGEARGLLEKAMRDRGCGAEDPSIQREFYARFVTDEQRQIFPYDPAKNLWTELPVGQWQYVVCADVGTVDATAVGVVGWIDGDPGLYLLKYSVQRGLGAQGQIALIQSYIDNYRDGLMAAVVDPGGGGAGLIVDLQSGSNGLAIEGAEKAGKAAACLLMRDALRTGELKLPNDPVLLDAIQRPEWDPDNVGSAVRGHFPDEVDMLLYGFRKARSLRSPPPEPEVVDPVKTAAEWMEQRWGQFDERAESDDWLERDWR